MSTPPPPIGSPQLTVDDRAQVTIDRVHGPALTVGADALRRHIAAAKTHLSSVTPTPTSIDVHGPLSIDLIAGLLAALEFDVMLRLIGDDDLSATAVGPESDRHLRLCTSEDDAVAGRVLYLDQLPTAGADRDHVAVLRASVRLPRDRTSHDPAMIEMLLSSRPTPPNAAAHRHTVPSGAAAGAVTFVRYPWMTTIELVDDLLAPLRLGAHVVISEKPVPSTHSASHRRTPRTTSPASRRWPPLSGRSFAVDLLEDRVGYRVG